MENKHPQNDAMDDFSILSTEMRQFLSDNEIDDYLGLIAGRMAALVKKKLTKQATQQAGERVICAAVLAEDDTVYYCHRHINGLEALRYYRKNIKPISSNLSQGFVTSTGRYVDRYEALQIQKALGIKSVDEGGYRGDILFSEDLY